MGKLVEIPFGTKISGISKKGIEFYWKKVEHASGYEVYRAYSEDGEYEKIAHIPKRNIGTYVDGAFDHNKKTVFYNVRSFVDAEDGERIFSPMAKPAEAIFVERLTLERSVTYMYADSTRVLLPSYGWGEPDDLIWSSDNEAVATVENNVIKAIAKGETTIHCTCPGTGQMATSKVVVEREATEPIGPLEGRYKLNESTGIWENAGSKKKGAATITMVGDLMCGNSQLEKQVDENGEWNFNNSYTYIRDVFRKSDFAVANLETLLSAGWPYMPDETYINNFNNCNAPARFLDAVRYGGFDAVMLANNHNCDGGKRALTDTIDQVNRYNFPNTGAFKAANDKRYFIADVNGIKVGFLAYMTQATGFNGKNKIWTKEEQDTMLNIFSYEKAVKDIKNIRADGAEYIIVYMHWGMKNFFNVTDEQRREAVEVAKAGADFIVGANPHVCQKFEMIKAGIFRKVPCYYSMGNFVAVMKQVDENRDSIIVKICLKRNIFGKVVLVENTYIPCRTYTKVRKSYFAPLALSPSLNKGLKDTKKQKEFHDRIVRTIGDDVEVMDKDKEWNNR